MEEHAGVRGPEQFQSAISYQDFTTSTATKVKVAHCHNVACTPATLSTIDTVRADALSTIEGSRSQASIGTGNHGLVSYHDRGDNEMLKVAACTNFDYSATVKSIVGRAANPSGRYGGYSSMAFGRDGLALISFTGDNNSGRSDLKVAHCANLTCGAATATTVDAFDHVGLRSSVAIGPDGLPLISYMGPGFTGAALRVMRCGSSDCSAPVIAPF